MSDNSSMEEETPAIVWSTTSSGEHHPLEGFQWSMVCVSVCVCVCVSVSVCGSLCCSVFDLIMETKQTVYRSVMLGVLLYGAKTWSPTQEMVY